MPHIILQFLLCFCYGWQWCLVPANSPFPTNHIAPLPAKKLYSLSRLNLHQTNHTAPLHAVEGQGVGLLGLRVGLLLLYHQPRHSLFGKRFLRHLLQVGSCQGVNTIA